MKIHKKKTIFGCKKHESYHVGLLSQYKTARSLYGPKSVPPDHRESTVLQIVAHIYWSTYNLVKYFILFSSGEKYFSIRLSRYFSK